MKYHDILEKINKFPKWHYEFDLKGVKTPIFEPGHVNRHKQRKKYFFDPVVKLCGDSLKGKTVLDLGCNAGFWSLQATLNGAEYVVGIDGKKMHIEQANFVFQVYEIEKKRYKFVHANIFDINFRDFGVFDIVLCLGLLYHVNKPFLLLEKISDVNKDILVIDTSLSSLKGSVFELHYETLEDPRNAVDYSLVVYPTKQAVIDIVTQLGYSVAILKPEFDDYTGAQDYQTGLRLAFLCSKNTNIRKLSDRGIETQEISTKDIHRSIIVLGMHRSGTSMIAGSLKILGVNMGKELLGANWSNPFGHFENRKFLDLNERVLKEAGGSWDNPPEKEKILAQKEKFSIEIQNLIKKEQSEIWGWKDPRTNLTIELYLPYLKNPYFLVCHRDALAIAEELKERDKMEIKEGERLVKIYEERINEFFQKYPELKKLDLYYEKITTNPEKWLKKIIDFLGIKLTNEQYREALNFILPKQEIEKLSLKMRVNELQNRVNELQNQLNHIHNLEGWKLLNKCYRVAEKILPMNTKRRKIAEKILKITSNLLKVEQ